MSQEIMQLLQSKYPALSELSQTIALQHSEK